MRGTSARTRAQWPARAKPRRKQQRERVIVSDSEQVGRPLAGPNDEDQADMLGESTAVADGSADGAGVARDAAEAAEAQQAEEAEEAEEADPVAAFEAELRQLPGEWYVVHSYAGYE